MKKLFAMLLALAVLTGCLCAAAESDGGVYALMTIPYDMFYEAETTAGHYDSVSSATKVKPLMMEYAGGSFHFMPDGREITGVIFPVYAESEEMLAMYGGEEITDKSVVTVSYKDKGKKVSTKYKGMDALFQSYPFSYYRLSEVPAVYKVMGWDSTFGPMQGMVITPDVRSLPYSSSCSSLRTISRTPAVLLAQRSVQNSAPLSSGRGALTRTRS